MKNKYDRNILILYVNAFCTEFAVWVPFFVLFVTQSLEITFTYYMFTEVLFNFSVFLLEVPTGAVSDIFSRKLSWILGSISVMIGAFMFLNLTSYFLLIATQSTFAFFKSFHSGSNEALIYDSLKAEGKIDNYPKILSNERIISTISGLSSLLISGVIYKAYGMQMLFLIFFIFIVISFVASLFLIEPERLDSKRETDFFKQIKGAYSIIVSDKKILNLAILMALVPAFTKIVFWLFTPLMMRIELSTDYWGYIMSLNRLVSIPILFYVPVLLKTIDASKIQKLAIYLLFTTFVFLALPFPIFVIIGFIFNLGLRFVTEVIGNFELNKLIESNKRATILSFVGLLASIFFSAVSLIVTLALDYLSFEFSLAVLFVFLLVPIYIAFRKFEKSMEIK